MPELEPGRNVLMIVLGIIDSKPSAAAIMRDGVVIAAIAEERLCRLKMADGMPRQAVTEVLRLAGLQADEIERVAVAQQAKMFLPNPVAWSGWFDEEMKQSGKRRFDKVGSTLAPWVGSLPVAQKAHQWLKRKLTANRLQALPDLLTTAYGISAPLTFYDHHYCHATSAYFTSGFNEALVITLDGGGDGRSGSIYVGREGQLEEVGSVGSYHSLGNFYSYITEICGFKAEKHEGKITGLAALGKPIHLDILNRFIRYESPGQIRYTIPMYQRSAIQRLQAALPSDFDKADLAASVQQLLEDIGAQFVQYWLRNSGQRNIALAGGVFGNVKFNQKIHELPEVENIFIHPAMDDSGLSVGAALAALAETAEQPQRLVRRLPNVYFGNAYDGGALATAVRESGLEAAYHENIHEVIAEKLAAGHVVARFTGAMEYGPRALGHRTILYQTTDATVNDWLNERLQRTEFMPFAPATLLSHAERCYEGLTGATDPARFMTITFRCTEQMVRQSPGVVHVDRTARPQLVDPDTAPDFHAILTAYEALTGIPSLINTSFNMHGEPIVCSPQDALRSFQAGHLDYLAMGNWLLPHPTLHFMADSHGALSAGST